VLSSFGEGKGVKFFFRVIEEMIIKAMPVIASASPA